MLQILGWIGCAIIFLLGMTVSYLSKISVKGDHEEKAQLWVGHAWAILGAIGAIAFVLVLHHHLGNSEARIEQSVADFLEALGR